MLNFCPVCKSLLSVRKERDKVIGYCSCGFKRDSGVEISSSETNKNKVDEAGVIKENINEGFLHKCSKCGWGHAELSELGEILNSEASVCLYTCKKCRHEDRETGQS